MVRQPASFVARLKDWLDQYRYPISIFFCSRLLILLIALLASLYGHPVSAQRWDAVYYPRIAAHGYTYNGAQGNGNTIAFFPLYPLTIWLLHSLTTIPFITAGYILSFLFGLAACLVLYQFVEQWQNTTTALLAVSLVAFAPFSVFFSTTYAEGLLFLLITASLYLIWQKRFLAAASVIGLALLTKATAFALLPCLILAIAPKSVPIKTKIIALVVSLLPFTLFMLYQWYQFGTPLAFDHAQQIGWAKTLDWPWIGLDSLLNQLKTTTGSLHGMWLVETASIAITYFILLSGIHRLPWSSSLFAWLAIIIVFSTNWPLSLSRYLLPLTPIYLAAALLTKQHPTLRLWLIPFLAALMGFFTLQFLQGGYVL